jgi:alanyl-tRNA synthetase
VTGRGAERYVRERLRLLQQAAETLQSDVGDIDERAKDLMDELRQQHKELTRLRTEAAARGADALLSRVREVDGLRLLAARVEVADMDGLRAMTDRFRERLGSAVVVLGAVIGDRPAFVVAVTSDLVAKGLHAGKLARAVAQVTGGGGGGRASMASAGGRDVHKLDEALAQVERYVKPED